MNPDQRLAGRPRRRHAPQVLVDGRVVRLVHIHDCRLRQLRGDLPVGEGLRSRRAVHTLRHADVVHRFEELQSLYDRIGGHHRRLANRPRADHGPYRGAGSGDAVDGTDGARREIVAREAVDGDRPEHPEEDGDADQPHGPEQGVGEDREDADG